MTKETQKLDDISKMEQGLTQLHSKIKSLRDSGASGEDIAIVQRKYNTLECLINCVRMDAIRFNRS